MNIWLNAKPLTHQQATQTEAKTTEYEPSAVNCPGAKIIHGPSAVEFPSAQNQADQSALENTLDTLIKDIQALNHQIK